MDTKILETLRTEVYVSGEKLGQNLGVSLAAVWKHIKELRKQGYRIESSPRLGYCLVEATDLLLPDEIKNGLETAVMGKKIIHYSEINSTQDMAAELAKSGAAEGTVVIAERQSGGRGRKGRQWLSSSEGGIYFSIVLRPCLAPLQTMQIPLIAAVAVRKAIMQAARVEPKIKWPNDILIRGKKVAGILTEMNCEMDLVNYVVLGIGLNVNTPLSILEQVPGGRASSISVECGERVSRVRLVQLLLREFENSYAEFRKNGFMSIREEWKAGSDTIGSSVKISDGSNQGGIEGQALDIDEKGFLWIRKNNGELEKVISGEVSVN